MSGFETAEQTRARLCAEIDWRDRQLVAAKASFEAACGRNDKLALRCHEARRDVAQLNAALRRKNACIKRLKAALKTSAVRENQSPVEEK